MKVGDLVRPRDPGPGLKYDYGIIGRFDSNEIAGPGCNIYPYLVFWFKFAGRRLDAPLQQWCQSSEITNEGW